MRIAIAKEGTKVSGHFGHCEGFEIYDLESGKVESNKFLPNPGHQPGFLPKFLSEQKTDLIIAGGMGGSAQNLFKEQNIDVIVGAQGNVEDVINQYINGELTSTKSVCEKHDHEDSCGGH